MTLHQIIFTNIDGDMVVIQGTNKADVFLDAYARLLSLPLHEDAMQEWCIKVPTLNRFYDWLNERAYFEFPVEVDGSYINTFIHYNTWEVTE